MKLKLHLPDHVKVGSYYDHIIVTLRGSAWMDFAAGSLLVAPTDVFLEKNDAVAELTQKYRSTNSVEMDELDYAKVLDRVYKGVFFQLFTPSPGVTRAENFRTLTQNYIVLSMLEGVCTTKIKIWKKPTGNPRDSDDDNDWESMPLQQISGGNSGSTLTTIYRDCATVSLRWRVGLYLLVVLFFLIKIGDF